MNFNTTAYNVLPTKEEVSNLTSNFFSVNYDVDEFSELNAKSKRP